MWKLAWVTLTPGCSLPVSVVGEATALELKQNDEIKIKFN